MVRVIAAVHRCEGLRRSLLWWFGVLLLAVFVSACQQGSNNTVRVLDSPLGAEDNTGGAAPTTVPGDDNPGPGPDGPSVPVDETGGGDDTGGGAGVAPGAGDRSGGCGWWLRRRLMRVSLMRSSICATKRSRSR